MPMLPCLLAYAWPQRALINAVADALLWIMFNCGVKEAIHYLDDFLFITPPDMELAVSTLQLALHCCQQLGVQVAAEKVCLPTTKITFLGIKLDSQAQELHADKLAHLRAEVDRWRSCSKRDLQSLLGLLNHAASVVDLGRTFMRLIPCLHCKSNRTMPGQNQTELCWPCNTNHAGPVWPGMVWLG